MTLNYIILLLVCISVLADALRDRWMPARMRGEMWWPWHLAKWTSSFFMWLLATGLVWASMKFDFLILVELILFGGILKISWNFLYRFKR